MKALFAVAVLASCQSGAPAVPPGYAQDIGGLCDSVHLAGASDKQGQERQLLVAMWLGKNLATPQAHEFLVHIQPLDGPAKAKALQDEAHRVGLDACPLAAEWRDAGSDAHTE
nr:hypothetical protein [Kofleriaceae bacterium]